MKRYNLLITLLVLVAAAGCGDGGVGSTEDAERAYFGLDASIDKAIDLGFDGFNAASSANIPPQSAEGDVSGTMTISGKVDQGSSNNKTMTLDEELIGYSDVDGEGEDALKIIYDTGAALPVIDMKLSKVPDGTLSGSLSGTYTMTGDLEGPVTLTLSFSGDLQPGSGDVLVERKPGTTHITGTADSDFGTYEVDITR